MSSDQVVSAKDVLQALMEIRRLGGTRVMEDLEAQEPDLTEFCLEELSAIHQKLLELRGTPKQARNVYRRVERLALALVTALRKAGLRIWREQAADGRLAQIDPTLAAGSDTAPKPSPPPAGPRDMTEAGDSDDK